MSVASISAATDLSDDAARRLVGGARPPRDSSRPGHGFPCPQFGKWVRSGVGENECHESSGGHRSCRSTFGMGSGDVRRRRRGEPVAECPNADHAGSWVVRRGRRTTKAGIIQVFLRSPGGESSHTFSVLVEAVPAAKRRRAKSVPAVPCPVPEHAGSDVTSNGFGRPSLVCGECSAVTPSSARRTPSGSWPQCRRCPCRRGRRRRPASTIPVAMSSGMAGTPRRRGSGASGTAATRPTTAASTTGSRLSCPETTCTSAASRVRSARSCGASTEVMRRSAGASRGPLASSLRPCGTWPAARPTPMRR